MTDIGMSSGMQKMKLELGRFPVEEIRLGSATVWKDGVLHIDRVALKSVLKEDAAIQSVDFSVASPGQSTRIVHLLDVVSPRTKVSGLGAAYPGFLGGVESVGSGRTHILDGMAVMTCCEVPWKTLGGLLMVREGIVDMSGELAPYTPFSETQNLVLTLALEDGLEEADQETATRLAGLRAAAYLATSVTQLSSPEIQVRELAPVSEDLPRVVYVCQIQSQGMWARTFFYGSPLDQLLPTPVHPNELADGCLVSGNQVYQCFKIPSWLHANNPIVEELQVQHGVSLEFGGVILCRGHFYSNQEKERSANLAARLASMMGADGVILTWEGGGNSAIDAMKTIRACERRGIATTAVAYELAGAAGDQDSLLGVVSEADAIVSAGSTDQPITLPRVERVLGGSTIRLKPAVRGVHLDAMSAIELENLHEIYCAANQLGAGRVRCEEY